MPHDPARTADTKDWLVRAVGDIAAAERLLKPPALFSTAVFHCQQAAEKALKGFLAWHDIPFRKTHNLEEIGEACIAIDANLRAAVDRAVPLTEYAWKFRYPGPTDGAYPRRGTGRPGLAREVYSAIIALLPAEAKP